LTAVPELQQPDEQHGKLMRWCLCFDMIIICHKTHL